MFAVIESGGKQYYVKPGSIVKVEKLEQESGNLVELRSVLALNDKLGSPYLGNVKVTAEILEHTKTDKVIIFKKKRRHNYRRKNGHRQQVTVLRVKEIVS